VPLKVAPVSVIITPGIDGNSWHADRHFGANGNDKGSAGSTNGYASDKKHGTHERDSLNVSQGATARAIRGSCLFTTLSIFRRQGLSSINRQRYCCRSLRTSAWVLPVEINR
jgi:hypothetical protein